MGSLPAGADEGLFGKRPPGRDAYRITDEQVQGLREAGWTDAQIAEAVYDGVLFNLFVRLADAFGIPSFDAAGIPGVLSLPDGA